MWNRKNSHRQKDVAYKAKINIAMALAVLLHLAFIGFLQLHVSIGGDGIFTYTLANNPYAFEYIDPEYKYLPESNGWIDAQVLRDSYIVEDYSQFNYSSVYFHQRIDNHPLAYYSLVHTICSIFKGTYSSSYTMIINLFFAGFADLLIIKLFKKKYGKAYYSFVPFPFLFLMLVMQKLYTLPRMYMMLSFFCLWYLYIHYELIHGVSSAWKKSALIQFMVCILLGSQTHYYFYVYAAVMSLLTGCYLFTKREIYKLINYVYAGIVGIMISWLIFPWVVWHIFFNQMQKHTVIRPWSAEKLGEYIAFLNQNLFNGRGFLAVTVLTILGIGIIVRAKHGKEVPADCSFYRIVFVSTLVFSLIIYTLDEDVWYYLTPVYLSFIILFSILLIHLCRRLLSGCNEKIWVSLAAACGILILSVSSTADFLREYLRSYQMNAAYSKVAVEHKGFDCIFVEKGQDNLFLGNFLEFGEYDEFKKISVEEYEVDGIGQKVLQGRKDDSGVVLYVPADSVGRLNYECCLLAENDEYSIYEMKKAGE